MKDSRVRVSCSLSGKEGTQENRLTCLLSCLWARCLKTGGRKTTEK